MGKCSTKSFVDSFSKNAQAQTC